MRCTRNTSRRSLNVNSYLCCLKSVGKRTLGDLFTKVKAKINEFEQGRQSGPQPPQQPQWAGGYDPQQGQYSAGGYAQYQHNHGSAPAPGAPASYYDPNAASPVISEQAVSPPTRTPAPVVEGYDVSPNGKCDGSKEEAKQRIQFLVLLFLFRTRAL